MTGNLNSKVRSLLGLFVAVHLVVPSLADEIHFVGDESLSGNILSITEQGILELESSVSPTPIRLKSSAVEKVIFSPPKATLEMASAMVELTNGDLLPATLLQMDEQVLTVMTEIAGEIVIPRKMLKSLQLGIRSSKVFYDGPLESDEWIKGGEASHNWKFDNQKLTSNGQAHAVRKLKLPLNFSVSFTLSWQGNPNLQVYLADPLAPGGRPADRYLLQFGAGGLEIKRESSADNQFTTVILSDRTPDLFPDKTIDIQVKIDRKNSRLQLWVNGELDATGVDPIAAPPVGNSISFLNLDGNGNGGEVELKNIKVMDFDDTRKRQLTEKRGRLDTDSLISRDDDRWGGRLLEIRKAAEGLVFSFSSDFQRQPLELLESDVSTLFFAAQPEDTGMKQSHPFVLHLHGEGRLQVTSCSFTQAEVLANHPLLGELVLARPGIASLECQDRLPVKESEK